MLRLHRPQAKRAARRSLRSRAEINKEDRKGYGNYLYGAYGSDYETRDGRRIYIVVVTDRMWTELGKVTELTAAFKEIETRLGKNFKKEGDRFLASDEISVPIREWCRQRTLKEIEATFNNTGVCWGPYRTFRQMAEEDSRVSTQNPLFSMVEQPGIGSYLVPGSPIDFSAFTREAPQPAPILGQHTDDILGKDLGLGTDEIKSLRDAGIVAGPVEVS